MVTIIPFQPQHAAVFKSLNLYWLDQYNLTEPADLAVLDNPVATILDTGGFIYLAQLNGEIVGSAALINEHAGIYELAKMAVGPAHHGKGISKLLLEKCLEAAKNVGAVKIILYSNSQLKAALKLYEKYGFTYVPVTGSPFETADIKMELSLRP
ncbi:GNAT family N-acetyltransferase [Foetidibacter luteolus]|uniref:GNAT family N-acetyltransferase n=1 Tax=Foetidibacter luteolus TaxID=2608880 RepID=UPI001A97FE38|nr:GNAT family N-acetyltransferase [Foetidibacter luteolus]